MVIFDILFQEVYPVFSTEAEKKCKTIRTWWKRRVTKSSRDCKRVFKK